MRLLMRRKARIRQGGGRERRDQGSGWRVGRLGTWAAPVLLTSLLLIGGVVGGAGPAEAVSLYHLTEIPTLGGLSSEAHGINNAGQVVGWSFTSSGDRRAFLYESGTMTDLGTLGGSWSWAYGINEAGQVVGVADTGSGA